MPHPELKHIKKLLGLLAITLVAVACENGILFDGGGECPHKKAEKATTTYVTATISVPTTRAESSGVVEDGQPNENKIANLCIFFYQANSLDEAVANNTEILGSVYFEGDSEFQSNSDGTKISVTKQIKIAKPQSISTYGILAVANAGDLRKTFDPDNERATVRSLLNVARYADYDKTNAIAWTITGGEKTNFIMSSERSAQVTITGSETPADPARVTVSLERMAARIDFAKYLDSYPVNSPSIATVKPKAFKLINLLNAGSYLFKRVSTDGTAISYLGDETDLNYVIDPWTTAKTENNLNADRPFDFNGAKVNAFYLYRNYFDRSYESMDENFGLATPIPDQFTGNDYYILDYTLENTTFKDAQLNGYSTGIMFQAVYIPNSVTKYQYTAADGGANVVVAGTEGETFFSSDHKARISSSLEAVVFPALAQIQPDKSNFFAHVFNTSHTYQDLKNYADRMDKDDALGFRAYLQSELEGKRLTSRLNKTISWNGFLAEKFGITNGVFTSAVIEKLKETGVNAYVNGICYYPYWIRHEDNGSSEMGIMEFGIVRNNVYKLKIISFSGLGEPSPYRPNTTPDEDLSIKMEISVRAWTLREHPSIIL